MRIKCLDCGHSEEVNAELFMKILGGVTAGFGFWAWVSFLFAGTGLALPICIAIFSGGAAILTYSNEIANWIVNQGYPCAQCGSQQWVAVSPEMEKEINAREAMIARLVRESGALRSDVAAKEKEVRDSLNGQRSSFSMEDVQELLEQDENQRTAIIALQRENAELGKRVESLREALEKVVRNLEKTFAACYSSLRFTGGALKSITKLPASDRLKLEAQFGFLQHNPQKAKFRDDIVGTDVKELEFGDGGRFYVRKEGARFIVVCVGNKNSQKTDIAHLKRSYGV